MRFKLYRCIACVMLFLGGILVFGSSNVFAAITELTPLAEFTGEGSGDRFSWSVSSAGDVNGDGYDDFIIGAYQYNSNQGRAYLFFGGLSITSTSASDADVILTGEAVGDRFGVRVSSAGDVNKDGYSDVIVGGYYHNGGSQQGRAYIFYGDSSMASESASNADVILTGEAELDQFGAHVASGGDVNNDGFDDVVVGARGYSGGAYQGRVYIFYGGSSLTSKNASAADVILTGEGPVDRFGNSASAADFNADGYDDVVIGAYFYNGNDRQGRAYIFYGSSSMSSEGASNADVILTGEAVGDYFAHSVSTCDMDNDGYSDVIVGAYANDQGENDAGRAYVFYGGSSMTSKGAASADVILTGEGASDWFGAPVSSAGDVNNDGYPDMVVSSAYYPGGDDKGRVYTFYGGSTLTSSGAASADVILDGESNNDNFGGALSSVGDVNDDGWNEWIVGAFSYPAGDNQGKVYLYNLNYASPSIAMNDSFYVNTTSSVITGTASETGVNVSGVQISVNNGVWSACTASDGTFNSANEAFSCSISGLAEGTYSLRVRSYDENGVYVPSALYATADLVVDFTPPSDGVVTISAGGSYTNSQTVTLNITAFDALAGVSQMMISEDPNFEGAEWQEYSETVEFTLSGESGTKVIYVRFMDRAGNVSGVYSYRIELLTETGADMSHTFTLGLLLLGVLVFTEFRKVYKKV